MGWVSLSKDGERMVHMVGHVGSREAGDTRAKMTRVHHVWDVPCEAQLEPRALGTSVENK